MPRFASISRTCSIVGCALLFGATRAWGAAKLEGLSVFGATECPAPEDVAAALFDLVPTEQRAAFAEGVEVRLSGAGSRYRVRVTTPEKRAEKAYVDAAEDCEKRVRVAAVFVYMTVLPPELWAEELEPAASSPEEIREEPRVASSSSAPPEESPRPPETEPARPASSLRFVRVGLAAFADGAPRVGSAPRVASAGVELRSELGRGPLRALLAGGYAPPADFTLPGVEATLWRVPMSAGVRWDAPFAPRWLGLEASLHGQVQGVRATSPLLAEGATRLLWGGRVGATFGPEGAPLAPVLGVHAALLAERVPLHVLPQGKVGELPRVWLGASLGFALDL